MKPILAHNGPRLMTEGERTHSMKGPICKSALLAVLLLTMAMLPTAALAKQHTDHRSPSLVFTQEDGMKANETLFVNGTSSRSLQSATWMIANITMFDQYDLVAQGDYLSSVTPSGENRWSWSLVVNVSGLDCTCELKIDLGPDDKGEPSSLYLYLGDTNHRPVLSPSVEPIYLLTDGSLTIDFEALTPTLSLEDSVASAFICQAPNAVCLVPSMPYSLNFSLVGSMVQVVFNASTIELPDGFWKFELELEDKLLRPSNTVIFTLHLDRQAPDVTLSNNGVNDTSLAGSTESAQPSILEGTEVLFSAEISDGYPGDSEVLTWSKESPSGVQSTFSDTELVTSSSVSLRPTESGEWTVILLVRDSAGHLVRTTSSVFVVNTVPTAALTLDGLTIEDGAQITLPNSNDWVLNASQSQDTSNDVDSLAFRWYINDVIIQSGGKVLDPSSLTASGEQTVRLVVSDDDGAESSLTFTMKAPQDEVSGSEGMLGGNAFTLALLVVLTLSLFLLARMGSTPPPEALPKWQRKEP